MKGGRTKRKKEREEGRELEVLAPLARVNYLPRYEDTQQGGRHIAGNNAARFNDPFLN